MDYAFVNTVNDGRGGKMATVRIINKELFMSSTINNLDRKTQYGKMDGSRTYALGEMSLDKFEEVFTIEDVKKMKENGLMEYYPKGKLSYSGNFVFKGTPDKYPIFKKEVYVKYGEPIINEELASFLENGGNN